MNIKIIIAVAVALLLGFIAYNSYSSSQNKKIVEARTAETEALRSNTAQAIAENQKNKPVAVTQPEPLAVTDPPTTGDVMLEPIEIVSNAPAAMDSGNTNRTDREKTKNETCKAISEMSESMMEARLNGIPIQKSLDTVDGIDMEQVYKDAFKDVVIQAYKQPSYQTDEIKERAIREFALKQYLACISAFDKAS